MHTRRPERLASFSYVGTHRYSLTFCTDRREPVFILEARVELVREQILRASREERFAVIAYCFMPDHVHLLVHGQTEDADLRRFVSLAKQRSGYCYAQKLGARLWQRYGYERVLRESEPTSGVARYILENPVRARLVERVEDYPFLGSFEYTRHELIDYVAQAGRWSG